MNKKQVIKNYAIDKQRYTKSQELSNSWGSSEYSISVENLLNFIGKFSAEHNIDPKEVEISFRADSCGHENATAEVRLVACRDLTKKEREKIIEECLDREKAKEQGKENNEKIRLEHEKREYERLKKKFNK